MKKIYIGHNSCLNAAYDLNVMKAGLERSGITIVDSPVDADEIIFSGCSVREHWVNDAISQIAEAKALAGHAKLTVTGCAANTSADTIAERLPAHAIEFRPIKAILSEDAALTFSDVDRALSQDSDTSFEAAAGLQNLRRRVGPAKASLVAELQELDRRHGTRSEDLYRRTTKGFVFYDEGEPTELITVTRSCLYKCSFCSIPQGRGDFESVPMDDILTKARAAVERNKFHLVLIGDEVGNYGARQFDARLPDLIERLLALHPSVTLSIRYIEPKPFLKFRAQFSDWSVSGRIRLLYVSLQSGSPEVLRQMNRGYKVTALANALQKFRENTSTVLYGNWMIGFPGETEADFEMTLKLVKALNFQINVPIPFSARPNTPAQGMESQVAPVVVEDRLCRMNELISDMKARLIETSLPDLPAQERQTLLSKVSAAEVQQYAAAERVIMLRVAK